jgi:hypothetical protein
MVAGPLEQLQLMKRLDMALVSKNCWPNRSGAPSSARQGLGRAIRACGLAETAGMVALFNQEFGIAMPLFLLTCRRVRWASAAMKDCSGTRTE